MGKLARIISGLVVAIVGLFIVAVIAFYLLFDANDFRDEITERAGEQTGRELVIEGDLSLHFFPWLAVEIGKTTFSNAPGFGKEPMASFDSARLSVMLWPLLRREIQVGDASIDGLVLNLAVARDGSTNWDDLAGADGEGSAKTDEDDASIPKLEIAGVRLNNATIHYIDRQERAEYHLANVNLSSGPVADRRPFTIDAEFEFAIEPDDYTGWGRVATNATLDSRAGTLSLDNLRMAGEVKGVVAEPAPFEAEAKALVMDLDKETVTASPVAAHILGLTFRATPEPFSYADDIVIKAAVEVEPFSLKQLMRTFGVEPPQTADPTALERAALSGNLTYTDTALAFSGMTLRVDDTNFTGKVSIPTEGGPYRFDLAGDSIVLDRYMAPAGQSAGGAAGAAASDEIEIPVDIVRTLEAKGSFKLGRAELGGLAFDNISVGLTSANEKLRLYPISAELFGGNYQGDVQVDASGKVPVLSVNERVEGVQLKALAQSVFERDDITGSIRGNFTLRGAGNNFAEIRKDLDGTMGFELLDGTWEGTDIWHQLRSARALLKKQPPPEPRQPPRTEFSSVRATGTVTDGVFTNQDLLAELPFLQVTGGGRVDLVSATVDYTMQARVLERPEFVRGATEEELNDFTEAVIPLRITGPLASPSVRPDLEAMFKARAKEAVKKKTDELKGKLLDKLLGAPAEAPPETAEGEEPQEEEKLSPEEELKRKLKEMFKD
jgi:AsmA protein